MIAVQKLCTYDYFTGYLQLLSQIADIDYSINYDTFCQIIKKIAADVFNISDHHGQILASGSIFLDKDTATGHIEYIVVRKNYTNIGYKERIHTYLINWAREQGCHTIVYDF